MLVLPKWLRWPMAAIYSYGAAVHVMNMIGSSGFDWAGAPLKWQILDVVYLVLDVVVVFGLPLGWIAGYGAFFLAAASQIVLYTLLRTWILDVPAQFARTPDEIRYLDVLVVFHLVTIAVVVVAFRLERTSKARTTE